jgi:katanin p80 WD40 repeat-containing subunit B1
MATGGQDNQVNVWAIGKTTALLNLTGHSSPIESVAIDWHEELLVAGSSSGAIKLWDLQHAKGYMIFIYECSCQIFVESA